MNCMEIMLSNQPKSVRIKRDREVLKLSCLNKERLQIEEL